MQCSSFYDSQRFSSKLREQEFMLLILSQKSWMCMFGSAVTRIDFDRIDSGQN
jgi:hypothetical protein